MFEYAQRVGIYTVTPLPGRPGRRRARPPSVDVLWRRTGRRARGSCVRAIVKFGHGTTVSDSGSVQVTGSSHAPAAAGRPGLGFPRILYPTNMHFLIHFDRILESIGYSHYFSIESLSKDIPGVFQVKPTVGPAFAGVTMTRI
jgi:hypothetical protein